MEQFENITNNSLESIKTILLDINFYKDNIKILKKKKSTQVSGPAESSGKGPVGPVGAVDATTSTGDYSTLPKYKE